MSRRAGLLQELKRIIAPVYASGHCKTIYPQQLASCTIQGMTTRPADSNLPLAQQHQTKHARLDIHHSPSSSRTMSTSNGATAHTHEPRLLVQLDLDDFPNAKAPTRGSAHAAGYDLYAAQDAVVPASNGRKVVQTGIRLCIPEGCYGRVAPRSGLASKHGIDVGAGVVDSDYRGLLGVLLFNLGDTDFSIKAGDRIAQLVIERIATPEVEVVQSLDDTVRGAGGFGSTGGFGPQETK